MDAGTLRGVFTVIMLVLFIRDLLLGLERPAQEHVRCRRANAPGTG